MGLRGTLFLGLFLLCAAGALIGPQWGIYGYLIDYCIAPGGQWWGAPIRALGFRFSFLLALTTGVGMLFQRGRLQFGSRLLTRQEWLLLSFLGIVWLSVWFGAPTIARWDETVADHPSVKLVKIFLFLLMMTHVVTDRKKVDRLFWVFTAASLFLGVQAWSTPRSYFVGGRLEGLGGPDFSEANFFASFMAAMLPIIGVQFLRSKWGGKAFCAVSAAFTANAVVLCRSRGSFVGIAAGVLTAGLFAPKGHRAKIFAVLLIGLAGGVYVTDSQFLDRVSTVSRSEGERDESASNRLRIWQGGAQMFLDHPFGVGAGNWFQTIGQYSPEDAGMDAHNTYVRCAGDLGIQGLLVYGLLVVGALAELRRVYVLSSPLPRSVRDDLVLCSYALAISLVTILMCGMTITMTYTEVVWLLLMLPVCLGRVLENELEGEGATVPTWEPEGSLPAGWVRG